MNRPPSPAAKVPEVTLGFWVLKILATTLGETGGDAFSMSLGWGYLASTAMFALILGTVAAFQIQATRFHPLLYWGTIVATTTVGTTLADFADRSLGIGYAGGSLLLLGLLLLSLFLWHRTKGSVAVGTVSDPGTESFYWVTILFSQTLGTALGDWTADSAGLGYLGGTLIFAGLLGLTAMGLLLPSIPRPLLFWTAFILTRPLGAVVGDLLDKPHDQGGLALGRFAASGVLLLALAVGVRVFPQRPAQAAH
jgi:uncharacterized membrane-anchored protein